MDSYEVECDQSEDAVSESCGAGYSDSGFCPRPPPPSSLLACAQESNCVAAKQSVHVGQCPHRRRGGGRGGH
jgi:hypothetical protein